MGESSGGVQEASIIMISLARVIPSFIGNNAGRTLVQCALKSYSQVGEGDSVTGSLLDRSPIHREVTLFTFEIPEEKYFPLGSNVKLSPSSTSGTSWPSGNHLVPLHSSKIPNGRVSVPVQMNRESSDLIDLGEKVTLYQTSGLFKRELIDVKSKSQDTLPPLFMVAEGMGIAHMIQIVRSMFLRESVAARQVHLLYQCQSSDDILFHEELDQYATKFDLFSIRYLLQDRGGEPSNERIEEGRLTRETLRDFFPKAASPLILGCGDVAGPTKEYVEEMNYENYHIRSSGGQV